jgi:endogenous inhibitor of DNA gyrase (YacG/DUF329 family)
MAKFRGAVVSCKICGSAFKVPPSRAQTAEFCSIKCASVGRGERIRKRVTLSCANCGTPFEVPVSHADRRVYCSSKCKHESADYLSALSDRTRGDNNPMWSGGFVDHSEGYIYASAPDHPFASNGYVLAHRLVMERWLRRTDPSSPFLIRLGGGLYLSPEFVVHHKDETKRNNEIGNLECLTPAEHTRLHSLARHNQAKGMFP